MIQICPAIIASLLCIAPFQETKGPDAGVAEKILLRKVFVPEKDIQKVIKGKFLPIKSDEFDELIRNAKLDSEGVEFKSVHYDLIWDENRGLRGKCYFRLEEELLGGQISFDSNLEFSGLVCKDSQFDFGILGTSLDNKKVLTSISGKYFECDVSLTPSGSKREIDILFPSSHTQTCTVVLPDGVTPICSSNILSLDLPNERINESSSVFFARPDENLLSFVFVDNNDRYQLSSQDRVEFLRDRVVWRSTLAGSYKALGRNSSTVAFDRSFRCSSVRIDKKEIDFELVKIEKGFAFIRLKNLGDNTSKISIEFTFEQNFGREGQILFRPVRVGEGTTVLSKVSFEKSAFWAPVSFGPVNFIPERIEKVSGVQFVQTADDAKILVGYQRRLRRPATEAIEVDFQNGHLLVRQFLKDMESGGAIRLNEIWEVLSAIDVQQDELPIGFSVLDVSGGRMLSMENENSSVWVVARKKLDSISNYSLSDCLPLAVSDSATVVRFEPGFIARFGDSFEARAGIQSPTIASGDEVFKFEEIKQLTFKLTADNQRFQAPFEADVRLSVGDELVDVDYRVRWNPKTSSRIIFELNEEDIEHYSFSMAGYGTFRQLTVAEKSRLGLFASRTYWAVEFKGDEVVDTVDLQFRLKKKVETNGLDVQLPLSIDNHQSQGTVELNDGYGERLGVPVEKLVETGTKTSDGYRVFQYSGESSFYFPKKTKSQLGADGLELHVMNCHFDVKSPTESIQRILFVYRTSRNSNEQIDDQLCLVSVDAEDVDSVTAKIGNQVLVATKISGEWFLELPKTDRAKLGEIRIAYRKNSSWPVQTISIPDVEIDGLPVTATYEINLSGDFRATNVGNVFSTDLTENLGAFLWLPTLAFDTETLNQIKSLEQSTSQLSGSRSNPIDKHVVLIRKEFLTIMTVSIAAIFLSLAIRLRRNRFVLYSCVTSLFFAFLFAEPFSLLAAIAFWGFALGLVIRELGRLCRFSSNIGTGTASLFCIVLFLVEPSIVHGQGNKNSNQNSGKQSDTVVPVIIPLDSQDKPQQIVYLPANFYERLKNQKPALNDLIFIRSSIEVSSQSSKSVLSGSYSLELNVSKAGRVKLPFYIENAIYDSDAVTIDSRAIPFQPLVDEKALEVDFDRQGKRTLQIDFQVAHQETDDVSIKTPFSGNVSIINRSGTEFLIRSALNAKQGNSPNSKLLKPNETIQTTAKNEIVFSVMDSKTMPVTIMEFIDATQFPAKRTIKLLPEKPFDRPVLLSLPSEVEVVNPRIGLQIVGEALTADVAGEEFLELTLENQLSPEFGRKDLRWLDSKSHEIAEYIVMYRASRERNVLTASTKIMDDRELDSILDKWNQSGLRLTPDQIGNAYVATKGLEASIWVVPRSSEITCFSENHFFASKSEIRLRSEWDLSSDSKIRSFRVQLPKEVTVRNILLGDKEMAFVRTSSDEVTVLCNIDQPGRYLFVLNGYYSPSGNSLQLLEPKVKATVSTSTSYLWTNREVRADSSMLNETNSRPLDNGFVFNGNLDGQTAEVRLSDLRVFGETILREKVNFVSAKSHHELMVELPDFDVGDWIGIDLPFGAELTEDIYFGTENLTNYVVEKSNSLRKHQIWIPLFDPSVASLKLSFDLPLENNEIHFASVINSKSNQREVSLPTTLGGDKLDWQLVGGEIEGQVETQVSYRISSSEFAPAARFSTKKQSDKSLTVYLQEVVFDPETKRLHCRFYLDPGNQSNCQIELPKGHFLESVEICGVKRQWSNLNGLVSIPMLSNRFFQVVDIETIPRIDVTRPQVSMELPSLNWDGSHDAYFQCLSQFVPSNVTNESFENLNQSRMNFLRRSIDVFEINRENTPGWQRIISFMFQSIKVQGEGRMAVKKRLVSLIDPKLLVDEANEEFDGLVLEADYSFVEIDKSNIQLERRITTKRAGNKIQLLSAIIILGILLTFTGKLPRWMRTPIFSMVLSSLIWVFGVTWISLTPESIFAWCWILFAFLFAILVAIDTILKLRAYQKTKQVAESQELADAVESTLVPDSQTAGFADSI